MLTNNIVDGYAIPAKDFRIYDFPRDMKIPTVDFIYQYIAGLVMRIPHMKDIVLAEVQRDQEQYKKSKKRILLPDTDLGYLFLPNDTEFNVQALSVLAFFLNSAKRQNKSCEEFVSLLLRMYNNGAIEKYYFANNSGAVLDQVSQAEYRHVGIALQLFLAASQRNSSAFSKLVHSLDDDIPEAESMAIFVQEAVGEKIWNARTLGDMQRIEGEAFHILPSVDIKALSQGQQDASPIMANERPRVSMLFANFRISEGLGIGISVMDRFVISTSVKKLICKIMYLTGNRHPDDMVHNALTDQRMHDAYISLLYMYAVSKHCSELYHRCILYENITGSVTTSLQLQESELNNRAADLDAREKALKEKEKQASSDVDEKFYEYRASALKREAALKDKIHSQEEQINRLKEELAKYKPDTEPELTSINEDPGEPETDEPNKESSIDYHAELTLLSNDLTIAFCGGNQNYINNLQAQLPGLTYINGKDIGRCDQAIRNCDVVLFCTQSLGHSLYGKVKNICRQLKIPYQHLSPVTSVSLSEKQIYDAVKACCHQLHTTESEDSNG